MERSNFIFTIGHGNRPLQELVDVVLSYDIDYLIDVRSTPYSSYCPQFARQRIQEAINASGRTKYAYLGDQLGGYPKEPEYQKDGKTDYDKYSQSESFQSGIARLRKGCCELGLRLCIMCSESDPTNCHRTRLISNELEKIGVPVRHIVFLPEEGRKENASDIESDFDCKDAEIEASEEMEKKELKDSSFACNEETKVKVTDLQGNKESSTKGEIKTTLLTHRQVLAGGVRKLKNGQRIEPDIYPEGGLFA